VGLAANYPGRANDHRTEVRGRRLFHSRAHVAKISVPRQHDKILFYRLHTGVRLSLVWIPNRSSSLSLLRRSTGSVSPPL
jgi:hypothetical protein